MAEAILLVPCDPVAILISFDREFCRRRNTGVVLMLKKSSQLRLVSPTATLVLKKLGAA